MHCLYQLLCAVETASWGSRLVETTWMSRRLSYGCPLKLLGRETHEKGYRHSLIVTFGRRHNLEIGPLELLPTFLSKVGRRSVSVCTNIRRLPQSESITSVASTGRCKVRMVDSANFHGSVSSGSAPAFLEFYVGICRPTEKITSTPCSVRGRLTGHP